MVTSRQERLIASLLNTESWVAGGTLCDILSVSMRTLQHEVRDVNRSLLQAGLGVTIDSNRRLGYRLEGDRVLLRRHLNTVTSCAEPQDNVRVLLSILLFERDYITIDTLSERLFLSRTSANACLAAARSAIRNVESASIAMDHHRGIRLDAPESTCRILVSEFWDIGQTYTSGFAASPLDERLERMRKVLSDAMVPELYIVEGRSYERVARYCLAM